VELDRRVGRTVNVHGPEVEMGLGIPSLARQDEVLERLVVVLLHPHPVHVHEAKAVRRTREAQVMCLRGMGDHMR
jgi:hypothetical protein